MPDLTAATSDQFQQILAAVRLFAQDTEANDALGDAVSEAYSLGITVGQARVFDHLTAERDRLAGGLVNARVERDEYRERMNDLVDERDGLDGELAAANRQIAARAERAEAERVQLVLDLGTMREVARGNRRHVATLTGILDTIEQLAKRWTDRPGVWAYCAIDILKAINSGIAAPVPGSSPRALEATDVTIRGARVFRPDERRCADPDRPVRIVVAGVAHSDLNADEAREIAAALVAAAAESQASEPAGEAGRG